MLERPEPKLQQSHSDGAAKNHKELMMSKVGAIDIRLLSEILHAQLYACSYKDTVSNA